MKSLHYFFFHAALALIVAIATVSFMADQVFAEPAAKGSSRQWLAQLGTALGLRDRSGGGLAPLSLKSWRPSLKSWRPSLKSWRPSLKSKIDRVRVVAADGIE
ncbi:hypothetical protein SAMN02745148_00651 [Modicisalibacter ilicicola DSM 19980]|uniref:Uncharacterized protein n=1 Tax=Modicisalibacter ilicicola DSM 19980 TaxID=1121942 RepID=A0A1M4UIW2_9GAMM|nr:hypothetical protein [Halomonas ilicicola]SHE56639.1 hypothetical protein SAMN02745148_00651 [Halomonas ilicicola DSM 19980]